MYACERPMSDPYALPGSIRALVRRLAADLVAEGLDAVRADRETHLDPALALRVVRETAAADSSQAGVGLVSGWDAADLAARLAGEDLPDDAETVAALRASMLVALGLEAADEADTERATVEAAREAGWDCACDALRYDPAERLAERLAAGPWEPDFCAWDAIACAVGYALGLRLPRRNPDLALAPVHAAAAREGYAARVLDSTSDARP